MAKEKSRGIKYGDPRVFFESKTTKPFVSPLGITHEAGAIVRGSAFIHIDDEAVSLSLPSMAELIYFQSSRLLEKASRLKAKALRTRFANENYHLVDEESFYVYMQLCSLGILGLYSSLETMVYELYIRKNKERPVEIDKKILSFPEFSNLGFERKITSVAAQLSDQSNIYGTPLMDNAKEIKRLRTTIQHWDVERREDYFINLPNNHPLKEFVKIEPAELSEKTRQILDHYSLKAKNA